MNDTAGYEYAQLASAATRTSLNATVEVLNNLATEGWELVSSHSVDKTLGLNEVSLLIRRRLHPLPPPPHSSEGWYDDPTGRWSGRYWNGQAWTWGVVRSGEEKAHRDPPTMRPPTGGLAQ